jgi:hypothetical protein
MSLFTPLLNILNPNRYFYGNIRTILYFCAFSFLAIALLQSIMFGGLGNEFSLAQRQQLSSPIPAISDNANIKTSINETQVLQSETNMVKLLADMVQNRIHDAVDILELTSIDPAVKDTLYLGSISKSYMGIPGNLDIQKRKIARDILNRDSDFGSVYFTTPKGDVYIGEPFANQKQLPKLNYADRDWYKGVTSTNNTYVSSVFMSASIHVPSTAIAIPVYSNISSSSNMTRSHLSGYWVGILDLHSINEDIKNLNLDQNDRLLVVDHIGTPIIDSRSGLQNATTASPIESIKSVLAGTAGSRILNLNGLDMRTIFQPLKAGSHTWGVVWLKPYHQSASRQ